MTATTTLSRETSFTVALDNEQATTRFAAEIANALEPGNMVTLSGDLGAGKTTFARALIRFLAGDASIPVPSPTFTLMQSYDLPRFPLVHADLYRLSGADELTELGLDDLADGAVVLMEWPDRAGGRLPANRIDLSFKLAPSRSLDHREVRVSGYGALGRRVERIAALRTFLNDASLALAERKRMQGDASTRIYERVRSNSSSAILMNAPRRTDGPPVRNGKPYSAIAHLAEDVTPFVAMADALRAQGFSAPEIYAADLQHGFLLLEDFGSETFVAGQPPAPIAPRYAEALDLLVTLHAKTLPATLPVRGAAPYTLPRFDLDAFLIEAELLLDWYVPHRGLAADEASRAEFRKLWQDALQPALNGPQTWVLRDFHSPNLIWLPNRQGLSRVGLLDFQDALIGPAAYDVASLLQDARVDVPDTLENELLARYIQKRTEQDAGFDADAFAAIYAVMVAQRSTKILGIFARLDKRDGKPQYLRHMPRVWRYLKGALDHPALAPLARWYKDNVPAFDGLR
jgi:tRNA threonylcarbamoyl adenosine modification protein YjeE